jgi:hypothetical protein
MAQCCVSRKAEGRYKPMRPVRYSRSQATARASSSFQLTTYRHGIPSRNLQLRE